MKRLGIRNIIPPRVVGFNIYDTSDPQKLPFLVFNYSIYDHHKVSDENFVKMAAFAHMRMRTANVMNLYDLSSKKDLDEDMLFAFAVALVTDTGFLKVAKEEELFYLSKFLKNRPLEEVFTVVLSGKIKDIREFTFHLSNMKIFDIDPKIAFVECADDDEFLLFVDLLMYPLDVSILVGRLPWGTWVYCRKNIMQKIYQKVLKDFTNRDVGRLYGYYSVDELLERIQRALSD